MAGPYAVVRHYLDKTIENNLFKHPPYSERPFVYDKDVQKLVEGEMVISPTKAFDAFWDWKNSNAIVKTAWMEVFSRTVECLRIAIKQNTLSLYTSKKKDTILGIKAVVITGRVDRDTGTTRWEQQENNRLRFSLTNFKYNTTVSGVECLIRLDWDLDEFIVEINVDVPPGDRAIRVILEPIAYDPQSDTTTSLKKYFKGTDHGRIFLSTLAAACKYNTLEMERVHIYLHM